MASLANKDEAEKCRDMGSRFLGRGEHEKAVRFLEKSLKMYPLPGVESMRDIAKSQHAKEEVRRREAAGAAQSDRSQGRSAEQSSPFSAANGSNSRSGTGAGGGGTTRRRASATASTSSRGGTPSTNSGGGGEGGEGGGGRSYTDEQFQAVQQVLDAKAKGHYAVLGVDKSATEDQIKKAYRKRALKFHPDKNPVPEAHEAFQAIGTAFAVLSDEEKRAHYNRFGDDDGPQGPGGGGGFGGGPFRGRYARHSNDVSPEDIFNMFFGIPPGGAGMRDGGAQGGGPFRVYRAGGGVPGGNGRRQEGQGGGGGLIAFLQLLPVALIMLYSLFGGSYQEDAAFSLHQTTKYPTAKVTTQQPGVVEGINYYVTPKFRQLYARDRNQLRRVEKSVTEYFKRQLEYECDDLKHRKSSRVIQAKRRRKSMETEAYAQQVRDAEDMPLPACQELARKFSSFSEYN